VTDSGRAALVDQLAQEGHGGQILLSSNAIGVAKGQPDDDVSFSQVLSGFLPLLKAQGLDDSVVQRILVDNPRELLTVR
jgi:phosphotriesterase-related protein